MNDNLNIKYPWRSGRFLILFLACLLVHNLPGQSNRIRTYTLTDGLPQSQVYDIIQDSIGYLWLGTQGGGISRFDGDRFTSWNERDGLISNFIYSLCLLNDSLLIGTREGLSIKYKKGFVNYAGPQINRICVLEEKIYLATNSGVYLFQVGKGLESVPIDPRLDRSIVSDIASDGDAIWIASNQGLWKTSVSDIRTQPERISSGNFRALTFYQGKTFAATFAEGILLFEEASTSELRIPYPERINEMTLINDNQLWVATDNAGVWVIDAGEHALLQRVDKSQGLPVLHIRKCFKDLQANIWIASSGGGLNKYAQNNFFHYDTGTGLKGNRIYAVHHTPGGVWASTSESGLVKIDTSGVAAYWEDPSLLNVKVKSIDSDRAGYLWAGTEGKGIFIKGVFEQDSIVRDTAVSPLHQDTFKVQKTITRTLNRQKGLPADWIREIYIAGPQVWVATYSSGIARFQYDVERDSLFAMRTFGFADGIRNILIRDIQMDNRGRLWYATQKGHLGYIRQDSVQHLGEVLDQSVDINTLLFHDKRLYLGTSGEGIWWSDLSLPIRFEKLSGNKALHSNNIYQLIADDENHLWAGSESGVDKIVLNASNQMVEVFHFGRNDGFLGIETCHNAVTKDAGGNIWFGTLLGLTQYRPIDNQTKKIKPTLIFEDIEIAYTSLDTIDFKSWSKTGKTLQLNPKENDLAFRYRTVDINNPEEIAYRWRLNRAEWSPWTSGNSINFAGLPYGEYIFEAQSRNKSWEESEVISFRFHILPPLHERPWFKRTAILSLILIFLSAVWLYVRRVKTKNKKEQERLQMENHLLSLEHKALQLQMNPHFVFNVLNGIKAMAPEEPEKMNVTINKFATLLRAVLENSRQEHIALEQEVQTLKNYIEVEQMMSTKAFTYDITVAPDVDAEEVLIPPMLIQPFVENAIRHGIMAVQRPGALQVRFWVADDFLHCTVTDNGIGIHESQKAKAPASHQSIALEVTRERIESLAGKGALQIKEIVDPDNKLAGTAVEFKIPLLTDF